MSDRGERFCRPGHCDRDTAPVRRVANLTLVTPETLTGGGSTVAVECASSDNGTAAQRAPRAGHDRRAELSRGGRSPARRPPYQRSKLFVRYFQTMETPTTRHKGGG